MVVIYVFVLFCFVFFPRIITFSASLFNLPSVPDSCHVWSVFLQTMMSENCRFWTTSHCLQSFYPSVCEQHNNNNRGFKSLIIQALLLLQIWTKIFKIIHGFPVFPGNPKRDYFNISDTEDRERSRSRGWWEILAFGLWTWLLMISILDWCEMYLK